ncbi:MAG: hypothetical protein M9928_15495 [Anaerolineae bacterium]|nr:hypothetical protein [Anaerolineae bacterium]MCO5194583.1 hypothetical protein [Anaerolineae bacterium]MCO5199208.1 hypothetical protein [Anaerolineae bacterium]MCO5206440.1 hypothetical protein [Anaerolineae bacterium]
MTYFERRMVGEVVMVAERNGAQATFMVGVLDCSTDLQSFALQTVGGELLCAFRYDDIGGINYDDRVIWLRAPDRAPLATIVHAGPVFDLPRAFTGGAV